MNGNIQGQVELVSEQSDVGGDVPASGGRVDLWIPLNGPLQPKLFMMLLYHVSHLDCI